MKQSPFSIALKILMPFLLLGVVFFIFSNSSKTGEISGALSQKVTAFLTGQVNLAPGSLAETIVRKLGHIAEFALLGFTGMLTLRVYTRRLLAFSAWPLLFGLIIGLADEYYQLSVPGRSGRISDVFIDSAGVLLGMGLGWLTCVLFTALFSRRPPSSLHGNPPADYK